MTINAHPFPTVHRPRSIIETLIAWRERTPERCALKVLRDGEQVEREISYRQLHDETMQVAAGLRARLAVGSRVLILLPTGVEFVTAFYGCLAAGMVAIPAHHPQQPKKVAQWKKLQAIVDNSGATLIVAPERSLEVLATMKQAEGLFAGCELDTHAELLAAGSRAGAASLPLPHGDELAFLQYTSGSTGLPKGVMITHANILNNQEVIAELMGHGRDTRVVSWLPLYHDMGLSAVLQMASIGCALVLLSPIDFIQKPLRWLQAISDHRASTSGGPNFAYQLAAAALQSPEAADAPIDLSSWQVAFCGAEPISRNTVEAFLQAAAAHGLVPGAFYPCYGMAEATVQVTGVTKGAGATYLEVSNSQLAKGIVQRVSGSDPDIKSLVACGSTRMGNEIRIVGPDGAEVAGADRVGEIWVRGGSIGAGYYGNAEATRETFGARLAGDDGAPFMRTGDLGAIVDGELYVTGRVKDMLIVRGRNLYPQDVEDCVQDSVPELRRGCGAAISVAVDGEEKLVVVQEVGRTQRRQMDVAATLRRMVVAIGDDFGITPHQVVLVEPATIEKTSSGKIARALCRRAYLQGQLRSIATWTEGQHGEAAAAATPRMTHEDDAAARAAALQREVASRIARVAAEFLKIDAGRVSRTTPWSELGFDSVSALQLALKVEQSTGLKLEATVLWECANIDELATYLAAQKDAVEVLARHAAPPVAAPAAAPREASGATSEAQLAALSDTEAEALLLKELAR
ncbi:MAG TPA: AMP-binding protein [Albitalea sp.]|nr:AMP-binding protein [Albitalea sp.]